VNLGHILNKFKVENVNFEKFYREIRRYEKVLRPFRIGYTLLKQQEKTDPNFPKEKKQWLEKYERTAMLLKRSKERLEKIKKAMQ
jgi:hypothetical protein